MNLNVQTVVCRGCWREIFPGESTVIALEQRVTRDADDEAAVVDGHEVKFHRGCWLESPEFRVLT